MNTYFIGILEQEVKKPAQVITTINSKKLEVTPKTRLSAYK